MCVEQVKVFVAAVKLDFGIEHALCHDRVNVNGNQLAAEFVKACVDDGVPGDDQQAAINQLWLVKPWTGTEDVVNEAVLLSQSHHAFFPGRQKTEELLEADYVKLVQVLCCKSMQALFFKVIAIRRDERRPQKHVHGQYPHFFTQTRGLVSCAGLACKNILRVEAAAVISLCTSIKEGLVLEVER